MKTMRTERETLSKMIIVRCTPAMKSRLEETALLTNLPLGEVIRRRLAGTKIPARGQVVLVNNLRELRRELARQGGLIKHLYNENPVNQHESAAALNEQSLAFLRISLLIEKIERDLFKEPGSE